MLQYSEFGQTYQRIRLAKPARFGVRWGTGVREVAAAMLERRPHRNSGQQAEHMVEIMCAISESITTGKAVAVGSEFPTPEPMPWASS